MDNPPTSTVTLFFADIEGATADWQTHQEELQRALSRYDAVLSDSIVAHAGTLFKRMGDSFSAAFTSPL